MRTTLILNDEVAVAARRLAAERRTSLSALVNEALRRELADKSGRASPDSVSIPVYAGSVSVTIDSSPAELDSLLNDDFSAGS